MHDVSHFMTCLFDIFDFGIPRIKILARRPAITTEVFRGFPQYLQANDGYYLESVHARFLPNRFKFTIHLSLFHSTLYGLIY
jgi:hypothetical protein